MKNKRDRQEGSWPNMGNLNPGHEGKKLFHFCQANTRHRAYGPALSYCYQDEEGMWAGNGEYESQVNFCPYCGQSSSKK